MRRRPECDSGKTGLVFFPENRKRVTIQTNDKVQEAAAPEFWRNIISRSSSTPFCGEAGRDKKEPGSPAHTAPVSPVVSKAVGV